MADQQQVTPEDPEVIRRQMEQTRSSLAEKLEELEQKVTGTVEEATSAVSDTVQEAKEAVSETIDTVKETVESTVDSVRETLDLSCQVQRHPWAMVGGSVALGFLGGLLLGPAHARRQAAADFLAGPEPEAEPVRAASHGWSPPRPEPETDHEPAREERGWLDWLQSTFGSEINKLKGMAIGTLAGVVRDMVAEAVPENLKPMLTDVINNVTTKLGGETIKGRVLPEAQAHAQHCSSTEASCPS